MNDVRLLYGSTFPGQPLFSSNLLWRTRFKAPDTFFLCEIGGVSTVLVSALEYNKAREEITGCEIQSIDEIKDKIGSQNNFDAVASFLKSGGADNIFVSEDAPCGMVDYLRTQGLKVVVRDVLYPERLVKTPEEINWITEAQRKAEKALRLAMEAIRKSRVASGGLLIDKDGEPLTSESIRKLIEFSLLQDGCLIIDSIVSCGDEIVNIHSFGSGPLLANAPIIIDIFPCDKNTGYWGDITRTVFKGKPSPEAIKLYNTDFWAQELALGRIHDGADGISIWNDVNAFFEKNGYYTKKEEGVEVGFPHGVGHGLGLDLHELPPISKRRPGTLVKGCVVTAEPGLYYPGNGARIEDVVVVTENGYTNLTDFPKELEAMIL